MIDYQTLKNLITATTALTPLVAAGQTQAIANYLNDKANGGNIVLTSLLKNEFLTCTAPAAVRLGIGIGTNLAPLNATVQAGWQAALNHARSADPGSQVDLSAIAILSAFLGDPVSTFVMTSAEYTAMTNTTGSLIEIAFGLGITCSCQDISVSLSL